MTMNQRKEVFDKKHEEEIAKLVEEIRHYRNEIDELNNRVETARENLEELLLDRGEGWKDEEGYAVLVAEGERTSYDTKALDNLLMSDPLRYGWLHDYRRKSSVAPSIKVK